MKRYCDVMPGLNSAGMPMAVHSRTTRGSTHAHSSMRTRSDGTMPRGSRWNEQMSITSDIELPAACRHLTSALGRLSRDPAAWSPGA